jgi:hypothetical protein
MLPHYWQQDFEKVTIIENQLHHLFYILKAISTIQKLIV